eukprot:scaffold20916_cov97-Isochrysis_galbana.AAC.5
MDMWHPLGMLYARTHSRCATLPGPGRVFTTLPLVKAAARPPARRANTVNRGERCAPAPAGAAGGRGERPSGKGKTER